MMSDNSNPTGPEPHPTYAAPWRICVLLSILGIVVLSLIACMAHTGLRMSATHAPLVDAAMEIKLEATTAHLWFEEIISGDRSEEMQTVWKHLDAARWYADVMLEGGENEEGTFIPLDDPKLKDEIADVKAKLAEFREITRQRLGSAPSAGIGSEIDQQYDAVFRDLITQADDVKTALQAKIRDDLRRFGGTQYGLLGSAAALFVLAGLVLGKYEQGKAVAFDAVRSARHRAETSKNRFRELFENMESGVAVYRAIDDGEDFVFTDFNRGGEKIEATKREDIIGKRVTEAFPGVKEFGLFNVFQNVWRTGKPEHHPISSYQDERLVGWRENYVYKLPSGEIVAIYEDKTEQKQAERNLRESENKFRSITENAVDFIFIKDMARRYTFVNRAMQEMLGLPEVEIIGKTPKEIFGSKQEVIIQEIDDRTFSGETANETRSLVVGGKEFFFNTSQTPLTMEDGEVTSILGIVRDVTESKQAERQRENLIAELEAKNAELERFTYTVSHDLRTPLVTISGFLGMLKQDAAAGNAQALEEDVTFISNATQKMEQLLDELLELSRIGRQVNPPEEIALADLAQEVMSMISEKLGERGIQVEIAPDLPVVFGDRLRLWEVLQNLVDNAANFMGDQPRPLIEIGSRRDGEETVCYVRDNGMGIDPAYHVKVFGLFDRLDPESEGTGVGLAVVKRVVEVHGGRIWVESEGSGQGSTFCFTIPRKGGGNEP